MLFGKLEEHEKELIFLENHEKKLKKQKDKNKEKEVDKKSIAIKASSSESSTKEQSDSEDSNDEYSDDEEMGLFVRRYNNLINFRRKSSSSNQDESDTEKSKGSCYNCGKIDHYKPDCLRLKRKKVKGHQKKSRKSRRAYITWESDSESSNAESSSKSDEMENACFMANHKKKNVRNSESKYDDKMSYFELQIVFENLHGEAKNAIKKLTSNKIIIFKDHIRQGIRNKSILKKTLNIPYRRYKFVEKDSNRKVTFIIT